MSGSDSITSANTAAMKTALISLLSIPSTSLPRSVRLGFPLVRHHFPLMHFTGLPFVRGHRGDPGENVLHGPYSVPQGPPHRLGQAHARADVGRLTRHHQAPPGMAAERGE